MPKTSHKSKYIKGQIFNRLYLYTVILACVFSLVGYTTYSLYQKNQLLKSLPESYFLELFSKYIGDMQSDLTYIHEKNRELEVKNTIGIIKNPTPVNQPETGFEEIILGNNKAGLYYPLDFNQENPYPVLIFHHGMASRYQYYNWIGTNFAKFGYVVVLPNRSMFGTNIDEGIALTSKAIDYLSLINNQSNAQLYQKIDLTSVAVAGHSMGGVVALSSVGIERIKAIVALSSGDMDYTRMTPSMMQFSSLIRNSQFVQQMQSSMDLLNQAFEQNTVPIMYLVGNQDKFVSAAEVKKSYEQTKSAKVLGIIQGANHVQFASAGTMGDRIAASLDGKATINPQNQQNIAIDYMLAWFNYQFKNDQQALEVLRNGPSYVPEIFELFETDNF